MVRCTLAHGSLRITNAGRRAVRVTKESRILADFGGGNVDVTPPWRRDRWWYPRETFSVPLPSPDCAGATVTIEHVGDGYDGRHEAAAQAAQPRVDSSVSIDRFTVDPAVLPDINEPATVKLSWQTTNATWVTLSTAGLVLAQQSELPVTVEQTTTFVLTAYDASLAQIVSRSATVVVQPSLVSRLVPKGTIALWSGSLEEDVPDHWEVCDGQDGRPDLTDRFVVGAGGDLAPGDTGDGDTHTHDVPKYETEVSTTSDGSHSHLFPEKWYDRSFDDSSSGYHAIDTKDVYSDSERTQNDGVHSHRVPITVPQSTTLTNSNTVRPPWYALFYIIKGD
ncbi:MAG TPA: hypothetical protein VEO54_02835 [Thermoanaerobaculia bacterium]|nr:hypothetical protein [Thermoanaerobaculia bacterium]